MDVSGEETFASDPLTPLKSVASTPSRALKRLRMTDGTNEAARDFFTLHEESLELERAEHHFPNLASFVDRLRDGCKAKWATRHIPYKRVIALLVSWEDDDLGVGAEIKGLAEVLRDSYHFNVETWAIPSAKRGYVSLIRKIESILEVYDMEDNLFILYYGGHACQDEQPQPTWISKREGGSSFNSSAILNFFQEMDADTLLLFDSCQAVPQAFTSTGKGVVSAITATGFEPGPAGIAAEVGTHSFTHSIIEVLGKLSIPQRDSSIVPSDVLLHSMLISELKKGGAALERQEDGTFRRDANGHHLVEQNRRRTPIYRWLCANKPHRPIRLSPLQTQIAPITPASSSRRPVFDYVAPEVLVSVRLAPDALSDKDMDAWVKWVLSLPAGATEVAFQGHAVRIEGLYRSYSSLVILRIPVETWTCMAKHRAFGFIGYVTGDNQALAINEQLAARIQRGLLLQSKTTGAEMKGGPTPKNKIQGRFDHKDETTAYARRDEKAFDTISPRNSGKTLGKSFFHNARRAHIVWAKARSISPLLFTLSFAFVIYTFFALFVYRMLLSDHVETPGGVFWDASTTNYAVTVLSYHSAVLIAATIRHFLAALRPTLAARSAGVSWATWTAQGASGWIVILQVALANRFLNFWSLLRLALPFLALALGSIVKYQADFTFSFVPVTKPVMVYAGLTLPSTMRFFQATGAVNSSDISMLLATSGFNLLSNSMYAAPFALDDCKWTCRSVILPGSISQARRVGSYLNSSIYSSNDFTANPTIRITGATGMVIRYDKPRPSDLAFDIAKECIYAGQEIGNGLQICIRQDGLGMVVGWAACPEPLYQTASCNVGDPPPWRTAPMGSATRMSLYEVTTKTSYDRVTQAIIDVAPLSSPRPVPVLASDYLAIFRTALAPPPWAPAQDWNNSQALVYASTWMHRIYSKTFPDDHDSRVVGLQNLLAVPVQFSVTALLFANSSASGSGSNFALPDNMVVEASGGMASSRLRIVPWTAWLFIGGAGAVQLGIVAWVVWWLFMSKTPAPAESASGIVEVDAIRAAARSQTWFPTGSGPRDRTKRDRESDGSLLGYILHTGSEACRAPDPILSAWGMAKENRGLRVREGFLLADA
ncbi:hypothetical protein OQA88_2523 [Cercophora sp. LCS_1]